MSELPPARKHACHECPWRRAALPGWLGPHDAETWVAIAQSDLPIACHSTINPTVPEDEAWDDPDILQCAGSAIFRSNICKLSRVPDVARMPADRESVFARPNEFMEHHQMGPRG